MYLICFLNIANRNSHFEIFTIAARFIESFPLTQEEKSVMARGRNANLSARKKMKGKGSSGTSATDFQDSTAFEALLGYTFISDKMRFADMMDTLKFELDKIDTQ